MNGQRPRMTATAVLALVCWLALLPAPIIAIAVTGQVWAAPVTFFGIFFVLWLISPYR